MQEDTIARRIGQILIKSGLLNKKQLCEALEIQKQSKKRLGEILIELDYMSSRDLIQMLSKQAAIPFVRLHPEMLNEKLIKAFPERLLYDNVCIPLYESKDELHIAIGDPTNSEIIRKFKEFTEKKIVPSGAEPERILQLLDKYFLLDQAERFLQK